MTIICSLYSYMFLYESSLSLCTVSVNPKYALVGQNDPDTGRWGSVVKGLKYIERIPENLS